jgi:hypothetical protein
MTLSPCPCPSSSRYTVSHPELTRPKCPLVSKSSLIVVPLPLFQTRGGGRCNQLSIRGVDPDVDHPQGTNGMIDDRSYGDQRLRLNSNQIPPILINPPPPPDLDQNIAMDEPHRAALGLCNGPDPHCQHSTTPGRCRRLQCKKSGQAAIMRSVFADNYDVRKFPDFMSYCIIPYSTSIITIESCSTTLLTWPCRRGNSRHAVLHGGGVDQVVGLSTRACGYHQLPG